MNRRELMLLGAAMTVPRALRAQQKAMPVIGFLGNASSTRRPARLRRLWPHFTRD